MASRFASGGLTDPALVLMRNISDPDRRNRTIEYVVSALAARGDADTALTVLDTDAVRVSPTQRASAYETIVTAMARSGRAAEALADTRYASVSDRAALAAGLASGGAVEEAVIASARIEDEAHRNLVLCGVAPKFAEARAYREARLAAERCQGPGRVHPVMLIVRAFALNEFPEAMARRAVLDKYRDF
jgi:hypothetical protein